MFEVRPKTPVGKRSPGQELKSFNFLNVLGYLCALIRTPWSVCGTGLSSVRGSLALNV